MFAIREAVGQLFEYRHFIGPKTALLFVLLDEDPGTVLVDYIENVLELGILLDVWRQTLWRSTQHNTTLRLRCDGITGSSGNPEYA